MSTEQQLPPVETTIPSDEVKRNGLATWLGLAMTLLGGVVAGTAQIAGDASTSGDAVKFAGAFAVVVMVGKYAQAAIAMLATAKEVVSGLGVTRRAQSSATLAAARAQLAKRVEPTVEATSSPEGTAVARTQGGTTTDAGVEVVPGEGDPLPTGVAV